MRPACDIGARVWRSGHTDRPTSLIISIYIHCFVFLYLCLYRSIDVDTSIYIRGLNVVANIPFSKERGTTLFAHTARTMRVFCGSWGASKKLLGLLLRPARGLVRRCAAGFLKCVLS